MRKLLITVLLSSAIVFAKVKVDPCQKQTAPGKAKLHPTPAATLMMACAIDQWEIQKVIGGTRRVISYLQCRDRDGNTSLFHRVPDHSTSSNGRTVIDLATSTEKQPATSTEPVQPVQLPEDEEPHR
jgi:hypothetical protein